MAEHFDQTSLGTLRDALEVAIHTSAGPRRGTVIWVVVVSGDVFVRSVRGPAAKCYTAAFGDGGQRCSSMIGAGRSASRRSGIRR
jgi:hypothetical protein